MTLEPPSGFEHATPGLGIQRLNHLAIAPLMHVRKSKYHTSENMTQGVIIEIANHLFGPKEHGKWKTYIEPYRTIY